MFGLWWLQCLGSFQREFVLHKCSLQTESIFLDRAVSESSKCKMQLFCKNSRQILTLLKVVLLQLAYSLPVNYTSQLLRNLIAWCLLCKYQDSISVCMGLIHQTVTTLSMASLRIHLSLSKQTCNRFLYQRQSYWSVSIQHWSIDISHFVSLKACAIHMFFLFL